jgi:uncharacterized membrane protein YeaQ/YmgE (transglycosylase-associated protein family)
MYLLSWILIGAVFGWGTGRFLKGNGYGPLMDVAMGIEGAVGGGFLMRSANIEGFAATIITAPAAVIGAAVVTILAGLANGRRIYASQL